MTMRAIALALVASGAAAATAHAQEAPAPPEEVVLYRAKAGDTLDLVAAEFYGDHARTAVILVEQNKLQRPYKLFPGERLRVPVSRDVATAAGDTFASLAGQYLGDPKRAAFLADYNHAAEGAHLATGTVIAIPFHVVHVAQGAETLAQIATTFFGDAKQADAIAAYNGLTKTALDKGETVLVPMLGVRSRPEHSPTLEPDGAERHEQQKRTAAAAAAALPIARAAWRAGDFAAIKDALAPLAKQLDYLDAAAASEIGALLGRAYVAFDDRPAATAMFQKAIALRPQLALSAYADSPKVLELWRQAGGRVQ